MDFEFVDSAWLHGRAGFNRPVIKPVLQRACEECRRKKSRCDMFRPSCSLCERTRAMCIYPTGRKSGRHRRRNITSPIGDSCDKHANPSRAEADALTSDWDVFFNFGNMPSVPESDQNIYQPQQQPPPQTTPPPYRQQDLPQDENPSANLDVSSVATRGTVPQRLWFGSGTTIGNIENMTTSPFDREDNLDSNFLLNATNQARDFSTTHGSLAREKTGTNASVHPESLLSASAVGIIPGTATFQSLEVPFNEHLFDDPTNVMFSTASTDDVALFQELQDQSLLSSLSISKELAYDLIDVYFERVQSFLPLLHRPTFEEEFCGGVRTTHRLENLDLETRLLLNGIFALSARFSTHSSWTTEPRQRGSQFADKARQVYSQWMESQSARPTLRLLQGYILLTYHDLCSNPSFETWLNTGVCCRIAYSLSLHEIDKASSNKSQQNDKWVEKEAKRRAWWVTFYMDNFASVIAARPFNIDANRMHVLLPVSDSAWFSNDWTVISAPLPIREGLWRSLVDCDNQTPYAWFIVCNGLLRAAHQEYDKQERSDNDLEILRSSLHCFSLALPPAFRSLHGNFFLGDQNLADKNWVICTLLLLQTAHIFTAISMEQNCATPEPDREQHSGLSLARDQNLRSPAALISPEKLGQICSPYISEHLRGVRLWSPDAIFLAHPMIACALLGPAAVHTIKTYGDGDRPNSTTRRSMEWHILDLSLSRLAEYWDLAKNMRDTFRRLIGVDMSMGKPDTTWIQGLLPDILVK